MKLWIRVFGCAGLLSLACLVSSCSFGGANVGDIYAPPAESAGQSDQPQVPESMKTGTPSGETRGPMLP